MNMCKKEFPKVASSLTKQTLSSFLFELAGYTYDVATFEITSRPFVSSDRK